MNYPKIIHLHDKFYHCKRIRQYGWLRWHGFSPISASADTDGYVTWKFALTEELVDCLNAYLAHEGHAIRYSLT